MEHLSDVDIYMRFIVALGLVLALIGLAAWAARFLGFATALKRKNKMIRRLAVVDTIAIDNKRRLILVSRDDVEHLLCIGGTTDFIIEEHIRPSVRLCEDNLINQIQKKKKSEQIKAAS
jgi:flagellar biogenesis protein FliO